MLTDFKGTKQIIFIQKPSQELFCYIPFKWYSIQMEYNKQEAQRATYRAPEYNVPPLWPIGWGGHLVFPIGPKTQTW